MIEATEQNPAKAWNASNRRVKALRKEIEEEERKMELLNRQMLPPGPHTVIKVPQWLVEKMNKRAEQHKNDRKHD